jgi:hypothetical protein
MTATTGAFAPPSNLPTAAHTARELSALLQGVSDKLGAGAPIGDDIAAATGLANALAASLASVDQNALADTIAEAIIRALRVDVSKNSA